MICWCGYWQGQAGNPVTLRVGTTADLSTALLRSSGRDDKGEGRASIECVAEQNPFFITLGGRRSMTSPVEMTKGSGAHRSAWLLIDKRLRRLWTGRLGADCSTV